MMKILNTVLGLVLTNQNTNAFTSLTRRTPSLLVPFSSNHQSQSSRVLLVASEEATTATTRLYSSSETESEESEESESETKKCEFDYALIFDCDGVIIETEELHRLAYNKAFEEAKLEIDGDAVEWTVDYYGTFPIPILLYVHDIISNHKLFLLLCGTF